MTLRGAIPTTTLLKQDLRLVPQEFHVAAILTLQNHRCYTSCTPQFYMEPEHGPMEKEIPSLETIILRFHVKLRGCQKLHPQRQPFLRGDA